MAAESVAAADAPQYCVKMSRFESPDLSSRKSLIINDLFFGFMVGDGYSTSSVTENRSAPVFWKGARAC